MAWKAAVSKGGTRGAAYFVQAPEAEEAVRGDAEPAEQPGEAVGGGDHHGHGTWKDTCLRWLS